MVEITGDRKRATLWTIGRGSRGLLRFSSGNASYVLAGTTTAKGGNTVHILRADEYENAFRPVRVFATEAEVWSIELVAVQEHAVNVIAVTRRKRRSSAEIWSLSLDDAQSVQSAYHASGSSLDEGLLSIDTKSSVHLEGNAIKVKRCSADGRLYLAITDSTAAILKVSESLDASVSVSWKCDELSDNSDESMIVDGGWLTDRHVFVASHSAVGIFESGTGTMESLLKPSEVIRKPATDSDELWVPSFTSRITAAGCGVDNALYIGGQDGSLRAFDLRRAADLSNLPDSKIRQWISIEAGGSSGESNARMSRMRWEVVKGHSQWVSVLYPLPNGGVLSGDIDGVVRCWEKDGCPHGTFPQHVDTVTGATASTHSFVTISYDGRIALNQVPMGA